MMSRVLLEIVARQFRNVKHEFTGTVGILLRFVA